MPDVSKDVKNLSRDVRELFLDAQAPVYEAAYARAVAAHHEALRGNKAHGWPEVVGGVFVCRDGYTIRPVIPLAPAFLGLTVGRPGEKRRKRRHIPYFSLRT